MMGENDTHLYFTSKTECVRYLSDLMEDFEGCTHTDFFLLLFFVFITSLNSTKISPQSFAFTSDRPVNIISQTIFGIKVLGKGMLWDEEGNRRTHDSPSDE